MRLATLLCPEPDWALLMIKLKGLWTANHILDPESEIPSPKS